MMIAYFVIINFSIKIHEKPKQKDTFYFGRIITQPLTYVNPEIMEIMEKMGFHIDCKNSNTSERPAGHEPEGHKR